MKGEEIPRVFVRGKYFPGLVNSRSIGDQVGTYIGVTSDPFVKVKRLDEKNNYILLLLTDGITNYVSNAEIEKKIKDHEYRKALNQRQLRL